MMMPRRFSSYWLAYVIPSEARDLQANRPPTAGRRLPTAASQPLTADQFYFSLLLS